MNCFKYPSTVLIGRVWTVWFWCEAKTLIGLMELKAFEDNRFVAPLPVDESNKNRSLVCIEFKSSHPVGLHSVLRFYCRAKNVLVIRAVIDIELVPDLMKRHRV